MISRSHKIEARAELLPAGTKLRLTRDRLLVRPLEWEPSRIISVIRQGQPLRGEVIDTGPGRYHRRYKPHPTDSRRRQYVESKTFIPVEVKPGDIVEFGSLNAFDGESYTFPKVMIGTELFVIIQEQDVTMVHEPSDPRDSQWSEAERAKFAAHVASGACATYETFTTLIPHLYDSDPSRVSSGSCESVERQIEAETGSTREQRNSSNPSERGRP